MSKINEAPCNDCGDITTFYLFDVAVCKKCYDYNSGKNIKSVDYKNGYNSAIEMMMKILNDALNMSKSGEQSINDLIRHCRCEILMTQFNNQQVKEKK